MKSAASKIFLLSMLVSFVFACNESAQFHGGAGSTGPALLTAETQVNGDLKIEGVVATVGVGGRYF